MHQHFLEEESARAGSNTLEREIVLEEESARVGSNTLEREILLEEGAEADQHVLELDEKTKSKNRDKGEGESGLAEGAEDECLNFYPRSKLFSSLLSR